MHVQRHDGVVGAGGRVGDLGGGDVGVGRVGDPPPADRRRVDAGHGEALAVRGPPVAAAAAHLLGGDELGANPTRRPDRRRSPATRRRLTPSSSRDAQRTAADVGDAPGRWDRAAGSKTGPGTASSRGRRPTAARPTNSRPARAKAATTHVGVGGVGDDDHRRASRARSRRARSSGGRSCSPSPASRALGIGDEALVAGGDVEHPEAVDRIVAAARPGEHDPTAVGRHGQVCVARRSVNRRVRA